MFTANPVYVARRGSVLKNGKDLGSCEVSLVGTGLVETGQGNRQSHKLFCVYFRAVIDNSYGSGR